MAYVNVDLRLLTGQPCEMAALQKVLENAPAYAERVTGRPPADTEAQSLFNTLPAETTTDNKYVYGVMADGPNMVGCAEVIRGWPTASTAQIALLLLGETYQGHGLGQSIYHLVEAKVRSWPEIDMLRISVVRSHTDVLPFWRRMGFTETGEVQRSVHDTLVSESIILTKPLPDEDPAPTGWITPPRVAPARSTLRQCARAPDAAQTHRTDRDARPRHSSAEVDSADGGE
jgi:GNAT superfamily N-acetyltransferase